MWKCKRFEILIFLYGWSQSWDVFLWGGGEEMIFYGWSRICPVLLGGGGEVKIKFQEQGGDFVWVFCWGRRWSNIENLWPYLIWRRKWEEINKNASNATELFPSTFINIKYITLKWNVSFDYHLIEKGLFKI